MLRKFDELLKKKARFQYKGLIGIEDLYSLQEKDLNKIYIDLEKSLSNGEGLLKTKKSEADRLTEKKMELVKHVFEYKVELREAAKNRSIVAENRKKYMELIASKETENLKGLSIEELKELAKADGVEL